jgi:hypothetical protein
VLSTFKQAWTHFCSQLLISNDKTPIESPISQSLIKIGLQSCLSDILDVEYGSRVDHLINHIYVLVLFLSEAGLHVE